tara:strand:+ start:197 stop:490 length:294 start_codon:yes stop_codon:yes gene_type:complete
MPPLRVYEVESIREDKDDFNTVYEFNEASHVANWLNEQLKIKFIKRHHIINYFRGACRNKYNNALTIAFDSYRITNRKAKTFLGKKFVNGRIKQEPV